MKHRFSFLSSAAVFALVAAPLAAWADANPDFDDDATPILRMQPDLLRYVRSTFEVKHTGIAKFPGDDDHPPQPPFIFRARPLGSSGPFNLRLMIQPGPPGHILGIVDITKVHLTSPPAPSAPPASAPAMAGQPAYQQPPVQQQPPPVQSAPVNQPPQTPPSQPTADTPSGPINSNGQVTPLPPPPSTAPSLAPPPDPPPAPQ